MKTTKTPLTHRGLLAHFGLRMGLVRPSNRVVSPAGAKPYHVCGDTIELTARQRRILAALPDAGGPAPLVLSYGRHAHHPGPHLADGVEAMHTERARWLQWGRLCWRIFEDDYCGGRSDGVE